MGKIIAICKSDKKGTVKEEIPVGEFQKDFGLEGDAHGGKWHRQVSLLSYESFIEFGKVAKIPMNPGIFGENLLIEGVDFSKVQVGDSFHIGDVLLEVTQIGKECHHGCEIRNLVGNCIMPNEGVFAKVLHGGKVKKGDEICFESES
ncbi:MAG: MOSC domain-containing protein [Tissierellia bacterium]|nr:MOSC domain-containing protein [Tissierellia bacterium]